MSYRMRRRAAVVALVIGLPLYVVFAVWLVDQVERPPFLVELAIYLGLGVLWALPLRPLFRGLGRPEPGRER